MLGSPAVLTHIARLYEQTIGPFGDIHFCVAKANHDQGPHPKMRVEPAIFIGFLHVGDAERFESQLGNPESEPTGDNGSLYSTHESTSPVFRSYL